MREWLAENMPIMTGLVTAMVALFGVGLTTVSLIMTGRNNKAQRAAMKEDRAAVMAEKQTARNAALSDRFARAIELLKDDSLAIRMGALFELKKLGLEAPEDQQDIVRILGPFIREGIENKDLLLPPKYPDIHKETMHRPADDIFIACEVVSLFYDEKEKAGYEWAENPCRVALQNLKAESLELRRINLNGADLYCAHFEKADLWHVHFKGAGLYNARVNEANLRGALLKGAELINTDLTGTYLKEARYLTAEQLIVAIGVGHAILDDNLRAQLERLKAA